MTQQAPAPRGGFRHDVKTLTDPAAGRIHGRAVWTYVRSLVALPAPQPPPERDTPRIAPFEFRSFLVPARMLRARSIRDGDIHLVIGDLEDLDATMVVELPSVRVGHRRKDIACTRRLFVCRFGEPPFRPGWLELEGRRANVYGVCFFDAPHHAAFGAPNGLELHPVIGLNLFTHPGDATRADDVAELAG